MELLFEWDEEKAKVNLRNHKISFDEAKTIFADIHSITIFDPSHSDVEDRFIDIGLSAQGSLLVVVYTERVGRIRIISCRKATMGEQKRYGQDSA